MDKKYHYGVAPCKGCEDRKSGCHGICTQYQQYLKEHSEILALKAAHTHARATHWRTKWHEV